MYLLLEPTSVIGKLGERKETEITYVTEARIADIAVYLGLRTVKVAVLFAFHQASRV